MAGKRNVKLIAAVVAIALVLTGTAAGVGWYLGTKQEPPKKTTKTEKPSKEKTEAEKDAEEQPTETDMPVTLYFADSQAQYLLPEVRRIPKTGDPYPAVFDELVKGPKETGHYPTMPERLLAKSITVENGVATIDFGEAFLTLYPRGRAAERMFIYSIVDTLTEFSSVSAVQFTVDGRATTPTGSEYSLSGPYKRDEGVIKK